MAEKTFITGNGKEISGKYGNFFNLSFKVADLQQYVNEKGYINITMNKRKKEDKYGNTHYFTLNEWKGKEEKPKQEEELSIEDIPF